MIKSRVILSQTQLVDPKRLARAIENALDGAAKGVQTDFDTTVATWERPADFAISAPRPGHRVIGTDDPIWSMLDVGTRPHIIRPRRMRVLCWIGATFRSKTIPRALRSRQGGRDNTIVVARQVNHPGTEARAWTETAVELWQERLPETLQRALDSEL